MPISASRAATLRALAYSVFTYHWDCQEFEDEHKRFCAAAEALMTRDQKEEWHALSLKATPREIVGEALRILAVKCDLPADPQTNISAIRELFPSLEEISTGGGCTALSIPRASGGYVLLTDADGSVPTDDNVMIFCGVYSADSESEESADVHINDLREWLEAKCTALNKQARLTRADELRTPEFWAAENIRTELASAFPATVFRVSTDTFSMGSTITVHWTGEPAPALVYQITHKYAATSAGNEDWCATFGCAEYVILDHVRSSRSPKWTYSIDDTDGDGERVSDFISSDLEKTKITAYEQMCEVFDGPEPVGYDMEKDEKLDKQYVPLPEWKEEGGGFVWDVYSDQTFIVRVFRA